jgi:hypothetical protein
MNQLTVTKLRNALARLAAEWQAEPPSRAVAAEHQLPFSSMSEDNWRAAVRLWRGHAAELIAMVADRDCPACGGPRSRWLFESYDLHPYHECEECGCWFVPKQVDWALFDRLFARSPEAAALARDMMGDRDADAGREADMARIGGYLDELLPMLPTSTAPIAYLDTGCGVGHSLRAGRLRGLRVQGIEVDDAALALARADGLPVVTPDETVPPGPYHLLSFWETLEHIADPLAALQRHLPLLADHGLVAITVPNLNALATRVMRESCPWIHGGYNTPGHINMFHAAAIERLLSRAGLTLLDADGQFSANPIELFAALIGATRGAFDNLDDRLPRGTIPERAGDLLKQLWPGAALLEQLGLASPILHVVACRRGREATFAPAIAARRARRAAQITARAAAMVQDETDYQAMAEALQEEINRREAAHYRQVVELEARLQSEIERRDRLISESETRYAGTIEARVRERVRLLGDHARKWLGRS